MPSAAYAPNQVVLYSGDAPGIPLDDEISEIVIVKNNGEWLKQRADAALCERRRAHLEPAQAARAARGGAHPPELLGQPARAPLAELVVRGVDREVDEARVGERRAEDRLKRLGQQLGAREDVQVAPERGAHVPELSGGGAAAAAARPHLWRERPQ